MFNSNGFRHNHRITGYLCKLHGVKPIGRAILDHVAEQADFKSALYESSSSRIAEELSTTRKSIITAQNRLKKVGLLIYPTDFGNSSRPYYVPLLILGNTDGKFIITRRWSESVALAIEKNLIPSTDQSGERLIEMIAAKGRSWTTSGLFPLLTKHLAADDFNVENIVGADIKQLQKRHRPWTLDESVIENGINNLERIKDILK